MNRKISGYLFALMLIVNACGNAPISTPTLSSADAVNTANAAAFTVIAQTYEARPSETHVPPSPQASQTPIPTDTALVLPTDTVPPLPTETPTFEPTITVTVTVAAGGDPCNAPLKPGAAGKSTKIKIVNKSNAPVTVSLYLNITPFGECGYRGYNLGKGDTTVVTDVPQGCYSVGAYINDAKKPTKSFGYGCINNPDLWTFEIYRDYVKFIGP